MTDARSTGESDRPAPTDGECKKCGSEIQLPRGSDWEPEDREVCGDCWRDDCTFTERLKLEERAKKRRAKRTDCDRGGRDD